MPKEMTLQIKGAMHLNADGSNRLFEIAMLRPGEELQLVPEPKNKFDPNAIAIYTARAYQIGYVSAERCGLIRSKLRAGGNVTAVFQEKTSDGGLIRVNFDGNEPTLPEPFSKASAPVPDAYADPDYGFFPDEVPPDDWTAS